MNRYKKIIFSRKKTSKLITGPWVFLPLESPKQETKILICIFRKSSWLKSCLLRSRWKKWVVTEKKEFESRDESIIKIAQYAICGLSDFRTDDEIEKFPTSVFVKKFHYFPKMWWQKSCVQLQRENSLNMEIKHYEWHNVELRNVEILMHWSNKFITESSPPPQLWCSEWVLPWNIQTCTYAKTRFWKSRGIDNNSAFRIFWSIGF